MPPQQQQPGTWTMNAQVAMQANPQYFVWWYTVKSVGLALVFGALCYYVGREHERRS